MGDRLATMDRPKIGGHWLRPFWGRPVSPSLTQCRPGEAYLTTNGMIHPAVWPQCTWGENWGLCPFQGAGSSSNTISPGWTEAYLRTKWHLDPFSRLATIDMGGKLGAVPLLRSWVPIKHSGLDRGLLPYQVLIQPFGHNADMGRKLGEVVPLLWGELGPHSTQYGLGRGLYLHAKFHFDLSNRLATMHQRHRQRDRTKIR